MIYQPFVIRRIFVVKAGRYQFRGRGSTRVKTDAHGYSWKTHQLNGNYGRIYSATIHRNIQIHFIIFFYLFHSRIVIKILVTYVWGGRRTTERNNRPDITERKKETYKKNEDLTFKVYPKRLHV